MMTHEFDTLAAVEGLPADPVPASEVTELYVVPEADLAGEVDDPAVDAARAIDPGFTAP